MLPILPAHKSNSSKKGSKKKKRPRAIPNTAAAASSKKKTKKVAASSASASVVDNVSASATKGDDGDAGARVADPLQMDNGEAGVGNYAAGDASVAISEAKKQAAISPPTLLKSPKPQPPIFAAADTTANDATADADDEITTKATNNTEEATAAMDNTSQAKPSVASDSSTIDATRPPNDAPIKNSAHGIKPKQSKKKSNNKATRVIRPIKPTKKIVKKKKNAPIAKQSVSGSGCQSAKASSSSGGSNLDESLNVKKSSPPAAAVGIDNQSKQQQTPSIPSIQNENANTTAVSMQQPESVLEQQSPNNMSLAAVAAATATATNTTIEAGQQQNAEVEEDALILAAEAAAALMEDLPPNEDTFGDVDIPLGLLDAVGTEFDVPIAADDDGGDGDGNGDGGIATTDYGRGTMGVEMPTIDGAIADDPTMQTNGVSAADADQIVDGDRQGGESSETLAHANNDTGSVDKGGGDGQQSVGEPFVKPTEPLTGAKGSQTEITDGSNRDQEQEEDQPTTTATSNNTRNNLSTTYYDTPVNALGNISQIKTFQSNVPTSVELSSTHQHFLNYYYTQEDAGKFDGLGMSQPKGGNEDEEIVEDDDEEGSSGGGKEGPEEEEGTDKENVAQGEDPVNGTKEGAVPADLLGVGGGGGPTLKAMIAKLKRSDYSSKKKKSTEKGVTFSKDGDQVLHFLPDKEDENLVADPTKTAEDDGDDTTNAAEVTGEKELTDKAESDGGRKDDSNDGGGGATIDNAADQSNNTNKDASDSAEVTDDTTKEASSEAEPLSAPQVEIGADGEIIIAQDSLLPNPETRKSTDQIDAEFGGAVVEDETPTQLGAVNASYTDFATKARPKPTRWNVAETKLFFRALRQCGTDFTMMESFCVGRTRSQLKRKFKMESRKNPRLVDMALDPRQKVKLDLSVFGDKLEIPDEVPTINVALTEQPSVIKKQEGTADDDNNYSNTGDRNFDHFFDQEETSAKKEEEDVVEEEYDQNDFASAVGGQTSDVNPEPAKRSQSPVQTGNKSHQSQLKAPPAASTVKGNTKKDTTKKKADNVTPAIVPLAPVAQKTKSKKARFKVKPKVAKKTKKK